MPSPSRSPCPQSPSRRKAPQAGVEEGVADLQVRARQVLERLADAGGEARHRLLLRLELVEDPVQGAVVLEAAGVLDGAVERALRGPELVEDAARGANHPVVEVDPGYPCGHP